MSALLDEYFKRINEESSRLVYAGAIQTIKLKEFPSGKFESSTSLLKISKMFMTNASFESDIKSIKEFVPTRGN